MDHILMVEDDQSLISGLSFAIEKAGYELTVARNGEEMHMFWSADRYDLVVLDVALPDVSGFELCEYIRKTSRIPILFLTVADEETDIVRGLDIGGDDYITKGNKCLQNGSKMSAAICRILPESR